MFLFCSDEPPMVTNQPKSLSKVCPGTAVIFAVQATGTEPLSYLWQRKPAEGEGGSEEWQPCPAEWSEGATLTIPSVQKSNEGSYCCVISNYAGTQTSNSAKLSVGKNPLKLISTVYTWWPHSVFFLYYTCSWSPQNHYTSPRVEGCCPRQMCNVQCWSHWNRTSELQMGVDSCWGQQWHGWVATMWFEKLSRSRQFHTKNTLCAEIQ